MSHIWLLSGLLKRPRVCAGFVVVLLLFFAAHAAINVRAGDTGDFDDFYRAAQAMSHGQDIYAATAGRYIYPPFLAFLMQPLTLVSEPVAALIWIAGNGFFLFAAIVVASREAAKRWLSNEVPAAPWVIAAVAAALASDKLHGIFTLGQTDGLILLAFACVLRWQERHPLLAGIAVGAAGCVKYLSLIFVPYFLVTRQYRAAVASVSTFVLCLILPALQIGFDAVLAYTTSAFSGLGTMTHSTTISPALKIHPLTWERSISLTSAAFRGARGQGWPDIVPVVVTSILAIAAIGGAIAICRRHRITIFASSTPGSRERSPAIASLEGVILVVLALTFSPQTTARHMALMFLVYAIGIAMLLRPDVGRRRWLIASLGLMMIGLSLPLRGAGLNHQLHNWRAIAGPSWCAYLLLFVVLSYGSRILGEHEPPISPASDSRL